jgi:hypothetical protein
LEKTKLVSNEKFIKENKNEEKEKEKILEELEKEIEIEESQSEKEEEKEEEEESEEKKKPVAKDVFMINLEEEKGQVRKLGNNSISKLTIRVQECLEIFLTGSITFTPSDDSCDGRMDVHLCLPIYVLKCPRRSQS